LRYLIYSPVFKSRPASESARLASEQVTFKRTK